MNIVEKAKLYTQIEKNLTILLQKRETTQLYLKKYVYKNGHPIVCFHKRNAKIYIGYLDIGWHCGLDSETLSDMVEELGSELNFLAKIKNKDVTNFKLWFRGSYEGSKTKLSKNEQIAEYWDDGHTYAIIDKRLQKHSYDTGGTVLVIGKQINKDINKVTKQEILELYLNTLKNNPKKYHSGIMMNSVDEEIKLVKQILKKDYKLTL